MGEIVIKLKSGALLKFGNSDISKSLTRPTYIVMYKIAGSPSDNIRNIHEIDECDIQEILSNDIVIYSI